MHDSTLYLWGERGMIASFFAIMYVGLVEGFRDLSKQHAVTQVVFDVG